jgi:hypothetical protein
MSGKGLGGFQAPFFFRSCRLVCIALKNICERTGKGFPGSDAFLIHSNSPKTFALPGGRLAVEVGLGRMKEALLELWLLVIAF